MSEKFGERPLERAIVFIFGFQAGLAVGTAKHVGGSATATTVPVVFDGGHFDSAVGDLSLETEDHWYLLEFKRDEAEIKDELTKPRVRHLRGLIGDTIKDAESRHRALLTLGREIHWIAYGKKCSRERGSTVDSIELAEYIGRVFEGYFASEHAPTPIRQPLHGFLMGLFSGGSPKGMGIKEFEKYVYLLGGDGKEIGDSGTEKTRPPYFQSLEEVSDRLVLMKRGATHLYLGTLEEFFDACPKFKKALKALAASSAVPKSNATQLMGLGGSRHR